MSGGPPVVELPAPTPRTENTTPLLFFTDEKKRRRRMRNCARTTTRKAGFPRSTHAVVCRCTPSVAQAAVLKLLRLQCIAQVFLANSTRARDAARILLFAVRACSWRADTCGQANDIRALVLMSFAAAQGWKKKGELRKNGMRARLPALRWVVEKCAGIATLVKVLATESRLSSLLIL